MFLVVTVMAHCLTTKGDWIEMELIWKISWLHIPEASTYTVGEANKGTMSLAGQHLAVVHSHLL